MKIKYQSGQIIIILLLLMLIILSVGLAITQRTITSISTSTQNEQSSRAFSAAEAGIEKATQTCSPGQPDCSSIPNISLSNNATAQVVLSPALPLPNQALEYPPIGKEEVAQFWLANPVTLAPFYTGTDFQIYFGNSDVETTSDYPAVSVNVITLNGAAYKTNRYFLESKNSRISANSFVQATCNRNLAPIATANIRNAATSQFYCRSTIPCSGCTAYTGTPMLIRVRLLYANTKHKIAIVPTAPGSLPPQATIYTSVGNAGLSQKTINVLKTASVVLPFFDFAIFSAGDIKK